jgi:hypothetical protein
MSSRMQISVGVCLILLRIGGKSSLSLEHLLSIGSDNGPALVAEVVQLMSKGLGITWKLHMAYRSQSSEKVEQMNRTLKLQL